MAAAKDEIQQMMERQAQRVQQQTAEIDWSLDFLTVENMSAQLPFLAIGIALAVLVGTLPVYYFSSRPYAAPYYHKMKKRWVPLSAFPKGFLVANILAMLGTWLVFVKVEASNAIFPSLAFVALTLASGAWGPSLFLLQEISLAMLLSMLCTLGSGYLTYSVAETVPAAMYIVLPALVWNVVTLVQIGTWSYEIEMKDMINEVTGKGGPAAAKKARRPTTGRRVLPRA